MNAAGQRPIYRNARRRLLLALFVAWPAFAADLDAIVRESWNAADPLAQMVREVRAKPDAFTYTELAIRVGREIYPGLEKDAHKLLCGELDALAARLREPLEKAAGPQAKAEVLAKTLYEDLAFRTATDEKPEQEQAANYFPHTVLKNKRGVCLGFTMVYLCLGERLGLPLAPAHAPQHIYVKWRDGERALSIETTARGRVYEEEQFRKRFMLTPEQVQQAGYFKPLGKLEVLGDLLNAVAWFSAVPTAERRLAPERSVLAAGLCVAIAPGNYNNWDTLAQACAYAGDHDTALAAMQRTIRLKPASESQGTEFWKERLERFTKAVVKE